MNINKLCNTVLFGAKDIFTLIHTNIFINSEKLVHLLTEKI